MISNLASIFVNELDGFNEDVTSDAGDGTIINVNTRSITTAFM